VAAAAAGLRAAQPAWEALGPAGRGRHLRAWLDWFLDNERRLAEMIQTETGKAWNDAAVELLVTADLINYFTRHAAEFLSPRKVAPTGRPDSPSGCRSPTGPIPWSG